MANLNKLLGITYLIGKIQFKLFFHGAKWLSKWRFPPTCWLMEILANGETQVYVGCLIVILIGIAGTTSWIVMVSQHFTLSIVVVLFVYFGWSSGCRIWKKHRKYQLPSHPRNYIIIQYVLFYMSAKWLP